MNAEDALGYDLTHLVHVFHAADDSSEINRLEVFLLRARKESLQAKPRMKGRT